MTTSEDQMTIAEATAILDHYHGSMGPIIEKTIIKVYKDNPSLDPTSLLSEIEFLKKEITILKQQLGQRKEETNLETFVRSQSWDSLLDIAKTVDPKKLTAYNEFKAFGEPQQWKLVALSSGKWVNKEKGVIFYIH